jgi:hypothetical protein
MKLRLILACVGILLAVTPATGQFRSQLQAETRVAEAMIEDNTLPSVLFGWFDASKFQMRHTVSFGYSTFGGEGMSLGTYTNSMRYQFAENFNARADISISYSPYNTLSKYGQGYNALSGIYLSNAQINYRPWENTLITVQYRRAPYPGYYGAFGNPFYGFSGGSHYDPFMRDSWY